MLPRKKHGIQESIFTSFEDQLNSKNPLFMLANHIEWKKFEEAFAPLYADNVGRPAKPIRLMVGLLLLKHIRSVSDESVVEQWTENNYYQYFCGEQKFNPLPPCEASELVHFRKRIGVEGVELIFKESIRVNGDDSNEGEAIVDTTVQEKNITFPTDNKLHRKIIKRCMKVAAEEGLVLRQTYTRTLKKLGVIQRHRRTTVQKKKAKAADRKVRTIAGRLVRELSRLLPEKHAFHKDSELYRKVLRQKRSDSQKVYSLHEPQTLCISKGKDHKKYEFGTKVSIIMTKSTGVILGALNFRDNLYDGNTLDAALEQQKRLTGRTLNTAYADRGYRGRKKVLDTNICIPDDGVNKKVTTYRRNQLRKSFCRRAAIEPSIGHLKSDHRLSRNYYKGKFGDDINILLAAAAYNFKRAMNNAVKTKLSVLFEIIIRTLSALSRSNWSNELVLDF